MISKTTNTKTTNTKTTKTTQCQVLEEDDTDKDGRLSYSEFMAGRRRFFHPLFLRPSQTSKNYAIPFSSNSVDLLPNRDLYLRGETFGDLADPRL